jgi:DNA-binding MarR family transcriptional regulator
MTPDGEVGSGFDEYLFYLVTHVINRRNRDFTPALESVDLTLAEWRALLVINRLDGCLMNELADFSTVDRTTLTRTVDHLVEAGLVARNASARDRRQVLVTLTDEGAERLKSAVEVLKAHNQEALNGLMEPELRTLRALLQRVLKNIIRDDEHFQQIMRFER